VLDPACGSGAFLNQAFNYLYSEGQKVNDRLAELRNGQHEIFDLDKHILSNNLYGVDINFESVEITKLSLWIKTANKYKELTALDDNIKCGNSLIDDPEIAGDKAFNWFKEFPEVFPGYRDYHIKKPIAEETPEEKPSKYPGYEEIKERMLKEPSYSYESGSKGFEVGGFDVIVCNPPYGSVLKNQEIKYFREFYRTVIGHSEIYYLFIEKCTKLLLRKNGYLGFITPNQWYSNKYAKELRRYLLSNLKMEHLINLYNKRIFEEANVENSIFIISKREIDYKLIISNDFIKFSIIDYSYWIQDTNYIITSVTDNNINNIINKIKLSNNKLSDFLDISNGFKPYQVGYGINFKGEKLNKDDVENKIYHSMEQLDDSWKKVIKGKYIHRYLLEWEKGYIKWGNWLMSPKNIKYFERPKILIREIIGNTFIASIDFDKYYADNTVHICTTYDDNFEDLKFYLAIINSKLYGFYFKKFYSEEDSVFPKIKINELKNLPIKSTDKEQKNKFIALVGVMLTQNFELNNIKNEFIKFFKNKYPIDKLSMKLQNWYELDYKELLSELSKTKVKMSLNEQYSLQSLFNTEKQKAMEIKSLIDKTDKEIDKMIYELYELTEEEIRIVEES
jgi:hypothetical protein